MVELRHYDNLGTARFVTFSCHKRLPLLTDSRDICLFLEALDCAREKYGFELWAYVVMPEHVHLLLYPCENTKLGLVIREIKSRSARSILSRWREVVDPRLSQLVVAESRTAFWLVRCYDHNCRNSESALEKLNYCHRNPVKRGLVEAPEEWEWSSARWYSGDRDTRIGIDGKGLSEMIA